MTDDDGKDTFVGLGGDLGASLAAMRANVHRRAKSVPEPAAPPETSETETLPMPEAQQPASTPEEVVQEKTQDLNMFIADMVNVRPKGDLASAEHPIYALRAGDKRTRNYEHNGNKLVVVPSVLGLATIHDKDILLYCVGQIVAALNAGRKPQRWLRVVAADLLKTTGRRTGKDHYERLKAALERLVGTRLTTTIRASGKIYERGFGLIDSWGIVREDASGRMIAIDIVLSEWLFNATLAREILTYHTDYYKLRGGLERRLYEIARKHCGQQPRWSIGLELLKKKTGSGGPLWSFRQDIKAVAGINPLPEYRLRYDEAADQVVVYSRMGGECAEADDLLRSVSGARTNTQ